ncbi:hypothetical protein QAD02_018526 [Eretmocerus hayati]|uniref:Uncharacterized protein n=1 Tax=Eretmocerus hayati TaxID=131215 RepID=A0ACC2PGM2_9HYME|nr:hypothetical protein QAD02_018526 [Eretmocerus hayati]
MERTDRVEAKTVPNGAMEVDPAVRGIGARVARLIAGTGAGVRHLVTTIGAEAVHIVVIEDVAERVKLILGAGLLKKNDRDKLLKETPRDGDLQLEAPVLNQEIGLNLHKDETTRDNFFRQYQKIIGAINSEATSLLNFFTEIVPRLGLDREESVEDRQGMLQPLGNIIKLSSDLRHMITTARKDFLSEGHEPTMQKILKPVKTT